MNYMGVSRISEAAALLEKYIELEPDKVLEYGNVKDIYKMMNDNQLKVI